MRAYIEADFSNRVSLILTATCSQICRAPKILKVVCYSSQRYVGLYTVLSTLCLLIVNATIRLIFSRQVKPDQTAW